MSILIIFVIYLSTSVHHFISLSTFDSLPAEQKAQYLLLASQLKVKDTHIDELRKQIGQVESKLRQQQQLYEVARGDKNHYSKGN